MSLQEISRCDLDATGTIAEGHEIAWVTYARDCKSVQAAVDPRTDQERLSLAHFFISNGKPVEALSLVRLVNDLSYYESQQVLVELLSGRQYARLMKFG